ncbi:hypothetical protein B0H14DRAFT_2613600 [Mycena olivaceomarginata]|nr:hypothetical protein B0H14DRAFT_2613600 [Mycena olivaceomarginata]
MYLLSLSTTQLPLPSTYSFVVKLGLPAGRLENKGKGHMGQSHGTVLVKDTCSPDTKGARMQSQPDEGGVRMGSGLNKDDVRLGSGLDKVDPRVVLDTDKTPGIKRDYFPSGHAMRGAGRAAASHLQGVRLAPGGLLCHTHSLRLLQGPTKTFVQCHADVTLICGAYAFNAYGHHMPRSLPPVPPAKKKPRPKPMAKKTSDAEDSGEDSDPKPVRRKPGPKPKKKAKGPKAVKTKSENMYWFWGSLSYGRG